jgi:hypothetical protein
MTIESPAYANTLSALAGSAQLGSTSFDPNSMTPDALILYLSTRLGNVDGQMDEIFAREKAAEKVRGEVRELQKLLTALPTATDKAVPLEISDPEFATDVNAHLNNIEAIDPRLGQAIREHLHKPGQICFGADNQFNTGERDASLDYLGMVSKDLESGSQMDMIALQSLMGARQTAIQLATNLVSALSESQKAIVSNIG